MPDRAHEVTSATPRAALVAGPAAPPPYARVLWLQRAAGNAAIGRLLRQSHRRDGGAPIAAPTRDPGVMDQDVALPDHWRRMRGTPFIRGSGDIRDIQPDDVDQGLLGDCYFLATLAALANANPRILRDHLTPAGTDTYDVRLFVDGQWRTYRVDNNIPVLSGPAPAGWRDRNAALATPAGSPLYARPADTGPAGVELWVMLYEKAWAMVRGSYARANAGTSVEAMRALTGIEGDMMSPRDHDNRTLARMLRQWLSDGRLVIANSMTSLPALAPGLPSGAQPEHAYAVVGVDASRSPPTCDLRNPWGHGHLWGFPVWGLQWGFENVSYTRDSVVRV